jgi:hypothetical protein
MADDKARKLWRFGEVIALAISFFSAIFLSIYFVNARPHTPAPSVGRIYFHDVHGQIAYLSGIEYRSMEALFWLSLFSFIVFAVVEQYKTSIPVRITCVAHALRLMISARECLHLVEGLGYRITIRD